MSVFVPLPRFPALLLVVCVSLCCVCRAAEPPRQAYGIDKRAYWTTSRVVGTPDPPAPYATEVAFPNLRFASPLAMTAVPKTNRLAIAERYGKIFTFENRRNTAKKTLLIDVKRTVYGVAFHPNYLQNGFVFVTNVRDPGNPSARGTRVSRFQVKQPKSFQADPQSEKVIIEWPSGGHNGGCLRFGPDGYLYISAGDSSGIADQLHTGQDLSDIPGSILRIDVDRASGGRAYAIPKDNPFINRRGARPEIFSYGHRQVWKYSFDKKTGRMWGGEVGQDLWEMIHLLKKGGNYGWSVMEGNHPFRPDRKKGPTPIVKPIVEQNHDDFRSITGGYVYHSNRLKDLNGAYIYGDYDTGRIWSFDYDGKKVSRHRELVDTPLRIVAFGQDAAGEVYVVDFVGGAIHRLVTAPPPRKNLPKFPRKLSETGLFASTKDHIPAKGLIPYSVNSPLYSDNAFKDRFIALPGKSQIEFDVVTYPQPAPGSPPGWRFPHGTVLVKTFSLEMEAGNPKSLRRLETRILHHEKLKGVDDEYGAQVWRGYTYVWNKE
ncbi:MAG: PQQ-dependent sugar dehydrogenase, partial [Planctomycetes bacterium]|nr:PQQ-dependent sugar dehydrogenase [Planctomycetota bacterium]